MTCDCHLTRHLHQGPGRCVECRCANPPKGTLPGTKAGIVKKLWQVQEAMGLTETELGRELGVARNTVTRWKMIGFNARRPTARSQRQIVAFLLKVQGG